jgi:hypothetical protein
MLQFQTGLCVLTSKQWGQSHGLYFSFAAFLSPLIQCECWKEHGLEAGVWVYPGPAVGAGRVIPHSVALAASSVRIQGPTQCP